jgi:hypothetical protein
MELEKINLLNIFRPNGLNELNVKKKFLKFLKFTAELYQKSIFKID